MIDSKLYLHRNKTVILGIFEDPDKFLETVSKIHKKGLNILDCYTPYPLHGIDKAMGLKRSLLPVGSFICGSIGFVLAAIMQYYMMHSDWGMIIGNKPHIGVSWVPVLFESTILCTAFGTAFLFFIRNKLLHGKIPSERIDLRQTDDRLIVAVAIDNDHAENSSVSGMLFSGGAVEVKERTNRGYEDFTDVSLTNLSTTGR